MGIEYIAIAISIASVVLASLSLGWNIYRDLILKARVDVSFGVATLIHESLPGKPQYLNIRVTNFGPGPVTISTIHVREAQVWRRFLRKVKNAIVMPDYTNAMSARLPAKIDVGDKIELLLPYDKDSFLSEHFTHIGVYDYYGRGHWAPKSDLKKAYLAWKKDFSSET